MRRGLFLVLSFIVALPLAAQLGLPSAGGPVAPPANLVTLGGHITQKSGAEVHGVVTAKIEDGWHINSAKPLESFAIASTLKIDPAAGELVSATFPPHVVRSFTFSAGTKVAVYEGTIEIPFVAKLKDPNAATLPVKLHYQGCNDSVCLPPRDASAELSLTVAATPATTTTATTATTSTTTTTAPAAGFTPLSAAPPKGTVVPASNDRLANTFASHGLPLTLAVLFVLGIALNLTPCVLPMIPITLGFFAMQSDGRRSRRFALSLAYVLGIVITYSSLGVLAALGGKMFGAWLQLPAVLIGLALLMLVLASSMFGAFDIAVPQVIANRAMGRAGLVGAGTMGLFVGIVAAPCVGPVVVSLITLVAQIGSPFIGFVMFAALALGLGFPYLALLNALPRPGEWMVQVKKGMGFVLVAMAFYFLRPLIGDEAFRWGVAASLLVGALFLLVRRGGPQAGRVMRISVGCLLLVAGVAFAIPPTKSGEHVAWQSYEASAIDGARAAHKPVVIDFYADWCLPCKELDEKTFSDKRVAAELDRFVRIKGNLTVAEDAKTQALTKQYAIVGVPTLVFIDANGNEVPGSRLTGFEPPEKFLERLRAVK